MDVVIFPHKTRRPRHSDAAVLLKVRPFPSNDTDTEFDWPTDSTEWLLRPSLYQHLLVFTKPNLQGSQGSPTYEVGCLPCLRASERTWHKRPCQSIASATAGAAPHNPQLPCQALGFKNCTAMCYLTFSQVSNELPLFPTERTRVLRPAEAHLFTPLLNSRDSNSSKISRLLFTQPPDTRKQIQSQDPRSHHPGVGSSSLLTTNPPFTFFSTCILCFSSKRNDVTSEPVCVICFT